MTEEQIKTVNNLMVDPEVKGKKWLKHFLWLNTVKPKFKVGDSVELCSDGCCRIWGKPVRKAIGIVREISTITLQEIYCYVVECVFVKDDGKTTYTTTLSAYDEDLKPAIYKTNTEWS